MKTVLFFPLLLLFSFVAKGQHFEAQKIYNEFETLEDVMILSLNKNLLNAIDLDIDYQEQLNHIEGDVHFMKTLITTSQASAGEIGEQVLESMANMNYKKEHLRDEHEAPTGTDELYLFTKGSKGTYSEVHFLTINKEDSLAVFFTLLGELNVTRR